MFDQSNNFSDMKRLIRRKDMEKKMLLKSIPDLWYDVFRMKEEDVDLLRDLRG